MKDHWQARGAAVVACGVLAWACPVHAQAPAAAPPPAPQASAAPASPDVERQLAVKWVRDSAEYVALARMVYGFAARAVEEVVPAAPANEERPRVAVLDVDETALDNSVYQLERAAYGVPFDSASWAAWVKRRAAGAVPGVAEFVRAARLRGLRLVWLSNRDAALSADTQANLAAFGLWDDGDRLCLRTSRADSKRARRTALRTGQGACSFDQPAQVVVYLGDQLGDFPEDGEEGEGTARADGLGRTYFLLPDPMYGDWTEAVTRPLP